MDSFSPTIVDFWRGSFATGEVLVDNGSFAVVVNPQLSEDRRAMVLATTDGRTTAVLAPSVAARLDLPAGPELSEPALRQALEDAGITLHDADCLFYYPESAKTTLLAEEPAAHVRRLAEDDGAVFAEFESSAPEQDRDDAYVELDHWAVFGSFADGRLASATSMYPWDDAPLADLGVLTVEEFRGKGHARAVVRAISRYAYSQGYEPQYRCQLDNHASRALAAAAGLEQFGTWQVVSPDSAQ
ncbi:GNAT family N-acetyltransferase [Arthrobacter sp. 35W]|uniref:GNAT family N-acetyltransferase n=1 Tax=Arthrobacter sp. 35W TaxID=1132441 RepID=UPI00041D3CC5|nr:GNAT family N-acetyltransferase [Arthrobacter sp. 35W]